MAFVAVVPAIGTGIAGIGGMAASGLAGLGGLASSIPAIGGLVAPALSGLGGAVGSLGAGLGGSLMGGGMGALTGGLGGAASSLLGSAGVGGGLGSGLMGMGTGLGGMYAGADKLLGGFLPNMGIGGTVAPAQGYLGGVIPGMQNSPMFGGIDPTAATGYGTVLAPPSGGFPTGGGIGGALSGLGQKAGAIQGLLGAIDANRTTTPTPQSVQHSINLQRPAPGAQVNGGQSPQRQSGIYNQQDPRSQQPQIGSGAAGSIERMYGN